MTNLAESIETSQTQSPDFPRRNVTVGTWMNDVGDPIPAHLAVTVDAAWRSRRNNDPYQIGIRTGDGKATILWLYADERDYLTCWCAHRIFRFVRDGRTTVDLTHELIDHLRRRAVAPIRINDMADMLLTSSRPWEDQNGDLALLAAMEAERPAAERRIEERRIKARRKLAERAAWDAANVGEDYEPQ